MIEHILGLNTAAPLYLGVDCAPAGRGEVLKWIAEKVGLDGLPLLPESERPERKRPGNKRCSNQRILESGYTLRYPSYKEGLAPLLG